MDEKCCCVKWRVLTLVYVCFFFVVDQRLKGVVMERGRRNNKINKNSILIFFLSKSCKICASQPENAHVKCTDVLQHLRSTKPEKQHVKKCFNCFLPLSTISHLQVGCKVYAQMLKHSRYVSMEKCGYT